MRRAFNRRFSVLVIPFIIVLLLGASLWMRFAMPFDGVQLVPGEWDYSPEGVKVDPLDDLPNGIHWGDLVVAVEGHSLPSWAEKLFQPGATRPDWRFDQTVTYTVLRQGNLLDVPITLRRYPPGNVLAHSWSNWLLALIFEVLALFILVRRPANRAVQIMFLWMSCLTGSIIFYTLGIQVSDFATGVGFWFQSVSQHAMFLLFCSGLLHFAIIFPRPHPAVRNYQWLIPTIYIGPLVLEAFLGVVIWLGAVNTLDWLGRWVEVTDTLTLLVLGLILTTLISGYERVRQNMIVRRRAKLVVLAIIACISLLGLLTLAHFVEQIIGRATVYQENGTSLWLFVFGLLIPLALVIAIVRYGLFRIRIIINRALVYSLLSVAVVGIYVLVVGALSQLFRVIQGNLVVSLIATGLVATIVQPLRERIQRSVNQLMYGERDDPYAVLSHLGKRLEGSLAPHEVLPILVETVATSLRLPYAALALKQDETFQMVAASGMPVHDVTHLPILYQREVVAELMVAPRSPGEPLTRADHRLLEDLARQAGVAVHTVRLTADLQHSRERLVLAREEERRRLRRDIHDGLGPDLASVKLKLEAAYNFLARDSAATAALLTELTVQVRGIIGDIHRVVYDLRPPALDELGLVPALRQYGLQCARGSELEVCIEAPENLPVLPAALEVAIYRIAAEALTNVIRHARARMCHVQLQVDGALLLEISDDGCGLSKDHHVGVGLHSMRERAAELGGTCSIEPVSGGGTRVRARLPLP